MDSKKPSKGILKSSSSFDKQEKEQKRNKATKWDEMNIIATYHPSDKDYGHMKINEPDTPYNWDYQDQDEMDGAAQLDPNELVQKLTGAVAGSSRRRSTPSASEDDEEEEDETNMTEEVRAKRREFKNRRKHHYNEFQAVKLARKLIEEEDDEDETEDPGLADKCPPADDV